MTSITKLLTSVLVIGGLGAGAYTVTEHQAAVAQTTTSTHTISEAKAKDIALYTSKGGTVTDIELESDEGSKKYDIEILKQNREFDIEIDAATGKVMKYNEEIQSKNDSEEKDFKQQNLSPNVSLEEAKKIALDRVKGTVTEAELEDDHNRLVYEFEISTANDHEIEVKVNAENGKVLNVELDD
ncbi:PepSY domain-containing protein [Pseudobacillus wudalianchiensis]|uniref:PepSY domain-containing protein n=1 Tax=Pseudobacillus wudalianchiensis TaxID=1743143 RepID=A0A1B9B9X1_9BACI|nr:PepSY domain-containing protein [Bacillus wudalianchiensis]OCA92873.1 hypothetical protein A8F95_04090 [Bacillus wudalianchiensis]